MPSLFQLCYKMSKSNLQTKLQVHNYIHVDIYIVYLLTFMDVADIHKLKFKLWLSKIQWNDIPHQLSQKAAARLPNPLPEEKNYQKRIDYSHTCINKVQWFFSDFCVTATAFPVVKF